MLHPIHPLSIALLLVLASCTSNSAPSNSNSPNPTASAPAPYALAPSATPLDPEAATSTAQTNENSAAPLADMSILPGEKVGPIQQNTTRQDLAKQFGESNLSDRSVQVGEGTTKPGTRVTLKEGKSFTVVWIDEQQDHPLEIREFGPAWKVPQDIAIGMSFEQLQEQLGEFQLYGFSWDYGGTLSLKETPLAKYEQVLVIRVQPDAEAVERSPEAYQAVSGTDLVSSKNANLDPLDLEVSDMVVKLMVSSP